MNKTVNVDILKLNTIANYARKINKSPVWVYELGKKGILKIIEIDGVKFVHNDN